MTLDQGQALFRALSQADKIKALLFFMHDLTIVGRDVFSEYAEDSEKRSMLLYDISQRNHRLTSAALEILTDKRSYPDGTIVEMMYHPNRSELTPYFRDAFERTMTFVSSTEKRPLL